MDPVTLGMAKADALGKFSPVRPPSIVLFGDSRTADCNFADSTNDFTTNLSWFDWGQACAPGGPVFDVIRNSGIAGNTTTQMLARVQADVIAYAPSFMTLWGGINDGWGSAADVDATFGRMVQIMAMARRAGIYVFLISETVASAPLRVNPYNALATYYTDLLRTYAATNPGIDFWNFNEVLINATTGAPKSAFTRDGLHLNALSASTIGKLVVAPRLAKYSPLVALPSSVLDAMSNNSYVRNVLGNPLMTGSGGTKGSGHTGTLPDNWASSGAHSVVCSVPARADGFGNDIQATITASASGTTTIQHSLTTSRITPGAKYVVEGSFSISAPTALYRLALAAQIFIGATPYFYGWGSQVQSPTGTDGLVAVPAGVFRSRIFTAPAGTYASANLTVNINFSGAGSATVAFGRMAFKRVA